MSKLQTIFKAMRAQKMYFSTRFFWKDYAELKKQKGEDKLFAWGKFYPIFNDKADSAGIMYGHYFHQDLHVAKRIFKNNPQNHLDIGSRIDGFVAHVATYRALEISDIRPLQCKVPNISFKQLDLMELPTEMLDYCDSISSLHAIEHFGLGRYNDPVDYFGYLKAIENIHKILKPNGTFYFSVPIGPQRIEFNAHRVFSVQYLIEILSPLFEIKHFSYVDDPGDFFENVTLEESAVNENYGCHYGCGIFELVKK